MNERCEKPPTLVVVADRPKVVIGERYTGRREFHWDSRTGDYSESLPIMGYDEWLIQKALCPPATVDRRKPEDVRQKT